MVEVVKGWTRRGGDDLRRREEGRRRREEEEEKNLGRRKENWKSLPSFYTDSPLSWNLEKEQR